MRRRRNYSGDPKEITAKFDSICAETGKQIKRGERCIYYPRSKEVFTLDSDQAQEFREWKQDVNELERPW